MSAQVADGQAVICHGNPLTHSASQAHEHVAARNDAAAALNEDGVRSEVVREVLADGNFDFEVESGFLLQPTRNLEPSDIVLLRMVAAGFADEHAVTVLEL